MNLTAKKTRVWINGINGKMGRMLADAIQSSKSFELLGGSGQNLIEVVKGGHLKPTDGSLKDHINEAQLIIDFSTIEGNASLLAASSLVENGSYLIATTGLPDRALESWQKRGDSGSKILIAANTSLGVLLSQIISKHVAKALRGLDFDIEISESHHRRKVDSPSGTALFLAGGIATQEDLSLNYGRSGARSPKEIGLSSLRGGSVFGEHTIHFMGDQEEISITHRALSRKLFADGALILSKWLLNKDSSGVFHLKDIDINELNY